MARTRRTYTIPDLITLLGSQMDAVYRMTEEDHSLAEQLKLLDMLGKTCSRLAGLIEQQRKTEGADFNQLNRVLQQALAEMRKPD